jgi:hypothetical protein
MLGKKASACLLVSATALFACARNAPAPAGPVVNAPRFEVETEAALVARLRSAGRLKEQSPSTLSPGSKVVRETDGTEHFVRNGTAHAKMRAPTEAEKTLQYWRHRFRGLEQEEREVKRSDAPASHVRPLLQLNAPSLGLGVVYDPEIDRVTGVIEYEARAN